MGRIHVNIPDLRRQHRQVEDGLTPFLSVPQESTEVKAVKPADDLLLIEMGSGIQIVDASLLRRVSDEYEYFSNNFRKTEKKENIVEFSHCK